MEVVIEYFYGAVVYGTSLALIHIFPATTLRKELSSWHLGNDILYNGERGATGLGGHPTRVSIAFSRINSVGHYTVGEILPWWF